MFLLSTQPYRGKCLGPESRWETTPSSLPQYVQTGQRLVQFFPPPSKTWNELLTDQNPSLCEQKSAPGPQLELLTLPNNSIEQRSGQLPTSPQQSLQSPSPRYRGETGGWMEEVT